MEKIKNKIWVTRELDEAAVLRIAAEIGCSKTLAALIYNRGFTEPSDAKEFLEKSQEILHDPFLFNGMDLACARIVRALNEGEKITIYGDYDVDGVTSVSILYLYLKSKGASVDYYIPSRKGEGYGVSSEAIDTLLARGTTLIITVDTGVTALNEVNYAQTLGIDVVVTDHHECTDELPNAVAVINPKRHDTTYPFANLAGVGVAFKLLCALEATLENISITDATRKVAYSYSDLAAIGTVADVMPVIDENRIIISLGLAIAEKTKNVGLRELIDVCKNGEGKSVKQRGTKKISSGFVGFTVAPRINAAGRIAIADHAVQLFLETDTQRAKILAERLCEYNKERQHMENLIADEAYACVENGDEYKDKGILVLDGNTWNSGVIGIVSSRVSERYYLPSILITFEDNDDPTSPEAIGKGSGRSVGGMNLVGALNYCSDLLEKYGGHELAAGLSIKRKNLPLFKERINEYAREYFKNVLPQNNLNIDYEIAFDELSLSLAREISHLEPYGVSNPTPVFASYGLTLTGITPVGMNRHLKLTLECEKKKINSMLFSKTPAELDLTWGDTVDIAYTIDINEFNGIESLQVNIKDIRLSQTTRELEARLDSEYCGVKSGETTLSADDIIPSRDEFGYVYQYLQTSARYGKSYYRYLKLLDDISDYNKRRAFDIEPNYNYTKIKTIIKVFRELNVVSIDEIDDFSFEFKFLSSKIKTSLDKSNILKKLKYTYQRDKR
jgi:single-stranded-DNA-specific exonuclease